jgi:hypothetical protein
MRFSIVAGWMAVAVLTSVWKAAAQTLPVRTGEHAGFTRIVVRIGEERQWDLREDTRAFSLSVAPGVDGFDLSQSFDLIQRDRLAELAFAEGELSGTLACDCDVSAFRYREAFLVIDIRDAGRDDSDAAPTPPPRPTRDADNAARANERAAAAAALPDLARILTGGPSVLAESDTRDAVRVPVETPEMETDEDPGTTPELAEAARIMAEQLARAAAAGLLTPASDTPIAFADPLTDTGSPDVAARVPELGTPPATPPPVQNMPASTSLNAVEPGMRTAPELHLRAQTALDPVPVSAPSAAIPTLPLACNGAAMGIGSWSVSEDVSSGIAELRPVLFDDRDQVVEASAVRLAQHYLSHGFGAEAQFWLSRIAVPLDDLEALAGLIAGDGSTPYHDVMDTTACSDEEFLLRFLGGAVAPPGTPDEINRLQRGFASLPAALQDLFGPDLARRLASHGHLAAARNIRDALHRAGRLARATLVALDLEIGVDIDAEQARQTLDMALRDDGASPAPAMAQALALDRSEGRPTDPDRVTAAAGLLRETPPGPDADALWHEIVVAQSRLGRIDTAIAMLDEGRAGHSAVWQQTVTEVLHDRLDQGDSATLLLVAHLFGSDWTDAGSHAGRVRMAAADRLQSAGLDAAAALILANGPRLILPQTPSALPSDPGPNSLWADGAWEDIARDLDGPHSELARRMVQRATLANATALPDRGIDLDMLAAQVGDSGDLRRTVTAVLSTRIPADAP